METYQKRNAQIMSDQKGDYPPNRQVARGENYLNFILNQLSEIEHITFKKVFGGVGFYREGFLFANISGGRFRLVMPADCKTAECPETETNTSPSPYSQLDLQGEKFCAVPNEVLQNKSLAPGVGRKSISVTCRPQ